MKRIIFSLVIVLMLVMMALLAANLLPMGAQATSDFGDAPDPTYPTLLVNNGARHTANSTYWLGTFIDAESDGQQNLDATGDDSNNLTDEDGVVFTTPLVKGRSANMTVTASVAGKLDAWVDFNDDGDWADGGEQIFTSQNLSAGPNNLTFAVPNIPTDDQTFARFRFSSAGGLSYVGLAADGEVEDYQVTLNEILSLECVASSNTTGVKVGQAINWTACAAGGVPPYSWLWTVNGTPVASINDTACINFTYAFNTTGFYTVCVNVTDSWGYMEGPCCTNVTVSESLNLTCDVSPNPTKVGHVTNFTAIASGGVGNYTWSWTVNGTPVPGPGGQSQNTTYNFTADGIYTVCINVTDTSGNTTQCCKNVTVNPPLSLECYISSNTTKVGQVINCTAIASGGVGNYSYAWDFGDNSTSPSPVITHNYTTAGNYTVCVNVTDSLGNKEGPCCTNVTVSESLNLTCDVSPNPTKVGHVTNFTAIASGGVGNYTWSWTVNGTLITGVQNTTYNFTDYGNYTLPVIVPVCVNVTDSSGNTTQCCQNVTVNDVLTLECLASANTTKVGQAINWTACAAGGVPFSNGGAPYYSWLWTVNGTPVASFNDTACINFTYAFNTTGIHGVCVNVTDSLGNWKRCCTNVTVSESLNLTCDITPWPTTKVGHVTNFTATASGGDGNYTWSWTVNGTPVPGGQNTTYNFTDYENYDLPVTVPVCVNVTDSSDHEEQCCKNVTVNPPLSLECLASANTTKVGQAINSTACAAGGVPPYSWLWTVNGTPLVSFNNTACTNITPTFNTTGLYTVCVNVTDSLGNNKQCCTNITVICELPTAAFDATPISGCAPLTVNFIDQSTGSPTSWSWSFPGGSPSSHAGQTPPPVTYNSPGTYTVSLNVSNACGSDTETKTGYITARDCAPPPPTAGGGGCCCPADDLTVDWEGLLTSKPLYSNDRLTQDLLGPSSDGKHSLLLEKGTLVPIIDGNRYYLITVRELEETPPLPENTIAIVAVNITPAGAVFDRDIFLTLGFYQWQLPEDALEGTITIAYYDADKGVWVPLESTQGERNGMLTMSATLRHLAIFAVMVEVSPPPPPQPAHFVASGLNIVPSVEKIWETVTFVTKTGETVTVTATITNDGGQSGTYTVVLKLDGETVDTETVTLGAGQSQQVRFTQSGLDYGQHEVEVDTLSKQFTTSRTITWWLIIVIIVAIGLIIWGVIWGRRRRRRVAQEKKVAQERRAVEGRRTRRRSAQEK